MAKKPKKQQNCQGGKKGKKPVSAPAPADSTTDLAEVPFDEIQHPKKRAFLSAFCRTGNITRAAEAAQIDRTTHFVWMKDAEYAKAYEAAQRVAVTLLEEEARRRATEGVRKLKFHEGQVIMIPAPDPKDPTGQATIMVPYVEHEYSDTLLIFLLKGNAPEKFRERTEVKHEGELKTTHTTHIIPAPVIGKLGEAPQTRG